MGPQHRLAPFVYRVTASCDLCHLPRWLSAPPEPSPHAAWRVPGTSAAPPTAPHSPQNTLVHSTRQAELGAGSGHSPGPGRVRGKRRPCQLLAHLPQGHGAELWLISETRFQDRQRPGEESKIPAGVSWTHTLFACDALPRRTACQPGPRLPPPRGPGAWSRAGPRPPLPPARASLCQSQRRVFAFYERPGRSRQEPAARASVGAEPSPKASPEKPRAWAPPWG